MKVLIYVYYKAKSICYESCIVPVIGDTIINKELGDTHFIVSSRIVNTTPAEGDKELVTIIVEEKKY